MPSVKAMSGRWAPPSERSFIITVSESGQMILKNKNYFLAVELEGKSISHGSGILPRLATLISNRLGGNADLWKLRNKPYTLFNFISEESQRLLQKMHFFANESVTLEAILHGEPLSVCPAQHVHCRCLIAG